jgi:outer membrane lipoprotein-sorting protein
MKHRSPLRIGIALALALGVAPPLHAQSPSFDPQELIKRAEDALRGETAQMKATMSITTPRWKREISFRSYDDRRGDRSFIRILEPKKDRGTAFLREGETFWTYLPRVERVTRVPPSMMLQPWMGSDLTNDDVARESSMSDDYDAEAIGEREIQGRKAYGIALLPHDDAPVVWSKVDAWVDAANYAPLLFEYYDEPEPGRFELLRRMEFRDVRTIKERPVPHLWRVVPLDKAGHETSIVLEEILFDEPLADEIFTQRNLKAAEAVR